MFDVSSDTFILCGEPVVLCHNGLVAFANAKAMDILGNDCVGRSVDALFDSELSGVQCSTFVANMPVKGKHYILRVFKSEGTQAIFFSRQSEPPLLLNDAFIYSLRSQLMNINVSASMMRERAEATGDSQILDMLSALTRSYYSMSRLFNNASTVRSMADNELPFSPRMVNMSELCTQMLNSLRWLCPSFDFTINVGEDITLCADPSLINLLLLNLLSNCLDQAKGATRIAITLFEAQGSVILSVSDDGCGIPKSELYSVFDRYVHGFDMQRIGGGAGLGLTVARGIAAMHGGTLLLESREGHGTTVRASFKKDYFGPISAKAPQTDYTSTMENLLVGLADCLPAELYKEKYLD